MTKEHDDIARATCPADPLRRLWRKAVKETRLPLIAQGLIGGGTSSDGYRAEAVFRVSDALSGTANLTVKMERMPEDSDDETRVHVARTEGGSQGEMREVPVGDLVFTLKQNFLHAN